MANRVTNEIQKPVISQLSKKEYKYKCKIIAENHLKKDYQKYLDGQVQIKGITYKDLYFDPMRLRSILSVVAFRKCSDAIRRMSVSTKQASDAFQNFVQTPKPWLEDDIDK